MRSMRWGSLWFATSLVLARLAIPLLQKLRLRMSSPQPHPRFIFDGQSITKLKTSADPASAAILAAERTRHLGISATSTSISGFRRVEYIAKHSGSKYVGYSIGHDKSRKRPGVVIYHTAVGVYDDFIELIAERVAALGYVVLLADMFGADDAPRAWTDAKALMDRNRKDRVDQASIAHAAFCTLRTLEGVDSDCCFVIGYCYGGQCALDLSRRYATSGTRD